MDVACVDTRDERAQSVVHQFTPEVSGAEVGQTDVGGARDRSPEQVAQGAELAKRGEQRGFEKPGRRRGCGEGDSPAEDVAVFRLGRGGERLQVQLGAEGGYGRGELKGVGAGLKQPAAVALGADVAPQARGGIEEPEGAALAGQAVRGGEAGDAATDDRDGKLCGGVAHGLNEIHEKRERD